MNLDCSINGFGTGPLPPSPRGKKGPVVMVVVGEGGGGGTIYFTIFDSPMHQSSRKSTPAIGFLHTVYCVR